MPGLQPAMAARSFSGEKYLSFLTWCIFKRRMAKTTTTMAQQQASPPESRRPRLLVVDDQAFNIQILHHIFVDDHDVFMATNGKQALKLCQNNPPDLILLDVVMPDMDGHEVCRRLKADPQTREIPLIFVTGQHDPAEETIGLELGAVDFISKPANPAVVRARVKTHLKLKFQADALEQVNQTLEARILERTTELKQAMEHLVQAEKLASLGSMVAGITHELASPLSNMALSASGLTANLKKLGSDISEGKLTRSNLEKFLHACDETLNLIERAAERAQTLLLSFKQVSVDQTSERRCRFDLQDIVEQTVRALGPTLKGTPFRVEVDIPAGIVLDSHPGALEQIITNLVNNSLAHAFAGRDSGRMRVCAQVQDGVLDIVYSDDGIGIPMAIRRRIFDPFFTTKAGQGGSGLGLYTIYNLVTGLFGGSIGVTSQADGGACFTLRLPISAPAAMVSHAEMHAVRSVVNEALAKDGLRTGDGDSLLAS